MYLFTVTMFPNEQNKKDGYEEFRGEQDWYFGALSKNGQILISICNTVFEDDTYKTFLLAPEQDSLDSKYANKYVNEFYMKLMNLCIREPEIRIIGRSSDFELSCNCVSLIAKHTSSKRSRQSISQLCKMFMIGLITMDLWLSRSMATMIKILLAKLRTEQSSILER